MSDRNGTVVLTAERLAELRARAQARDEAHRGGYEPEALCDDDILTLLDIREIHEGAQAFRGDRAGRSMREIAEFEVVVSRSEYVCMAEALLRAAEERNELRARLRRDCKGCPGCGSNDCPDALDAAQHERDRLRAENETLRKRAVECMPMLETLREALGTDLGSGGGFVSVLDGIDRLRGQRDALVAVLQSGQSLRTHDLNTTERWVIDDVDEVREVLRAAKENQ